MEIMMEMIEYLQAIPASRDKLIVINTMSKFCIQGKARIFPGRSAAGRGHDQSGRGLRDDCNIGLAIDEAGGHSRTFGGLRLFVHGSQVELDLLRNLHDSDLRKIKHDVQRLEGQSLDFECKKK